MAEKRKYLKKAVSRVAAIQLDLETEGFTYLKWGGPQFCKARDYLVNNQGDVYTVDSGTFERTYREVSPGSYTSVRPVWAERADTGGQIETKEGVTHYDAGDYLVYSDADGVDCWAVNASVFEEMYEPVP